MATSRLTGLWWWIDRWRKSTAYMDMTLEEQGAYRNLLDEAALRGGPLPTDERVLAKASGDALRWPEVRDVVLARFRATADGWRNDTLYSVLAESRRRAKKQRSYRRKGGNGAGNDAGNNYRPPDPDPDPDLPLEVFGYLKDQNSRANKTARRETTTNRRKRTDDTRR